MRGAREGRGRALCYIVRLEYGNVMQAESVRLCPLVKGMMNAGIFTFLLFLEDDLYVLVGVYFCSFVCCCYFVYDFIVLFWFLPRGLRTTASCEPDLYFGNRW